MARPTEKGLKFFAFDVGFFTDDRRVRALRQRYHGNGIAVYIYILCEVYKEGYYYPVPIWNDFIGDMAECLHMSANAVEQIIAFMRSRALIHVFKKKEELSGLDIDAVITGHGIQTRYAKAMKAMRRKSTSEIKGKFWLLTEEEERKIDSPKEEREIDSSCKRTENDGFYGNNYGFYGNNPDKSEKNPTEYKSTNNIVTTNNDISNNSTYIGTDVQILFQEAGEARQEARRAFFAKYTNLKDDPSVDDSHIDYGKLSERFARSKKQLQNMHSLAWVVRNYTAILEDKYVDYARATPSGSSAASFAPSTPKEKPLPADVLAANAKAERERFYARRREKAQNTAEKLTERIKQKEPRFKEITAELSKMEIALAKAEVFEPSKLPALKQEKGALLTERWEILARLGIKEEQLLPEFYYVCKRCQDTGFLPSGASCKCYKKEN